MQLTGKSLFVLSILASAASAADVWTNRYGRVFSANLLSVSDAGAVFVFAEDGATNSLPFSKLSRESAKRACDRFEFAPIPPRLAATYERASSDLKRIADLKEDGVLSSEKATSRVEAVLSAFKEVCREKGFDRETAVRLSNRLNR